MTHDSLRPFTDALRSRRDDTLGAAMPRANFADVLARADRRRNAAPTEPLLAAAPTTTATEPDDEVEHHDPAVEAFASALHQRYARVLARRDAPPSSARPRRSRVPLYAGVALAAALLFGVGIAVRLSSSQLNRSETGMDPMGAMRERDSAPGREGIAQPRTRASEMHERSVTPPTDPAPEPEPEPKLEVEPTEPPTSEAEEAAPIEAPPRTAPRKRRATETQPPLHDDPVTALEAAAREAWAQGRLATAERHLRAILRLEGKSRRAELAYGDLFSLALQRSGAAGQAAVWREYLQVFPRGTFAEDARAGLCRRHELDARADCWADYLERHPRGSHVAEARRHLDEAAP